MFKSFSKINAVLTNIKFLFIFFILLILFVEFLSFIFTKYKLLIVNHEPNYIHEQGNKWRTENTPWGSWHKSNFKDEHSSACFKTNYQSNNLGARDTKDYNKDIPKNSLVLIGDSFAEGWGVDLENIFPKILEKKIKRVVLNFGSSGNFGPVQAEILYNNLASKIPHNALIYFFLPSNDFTDNDIRYWSDNIHSARNRPYFKKINENNYKVTYPNQKIKNKFLFSGKDFLFLRLKSFLIKYTYTANTLRTLNALISKSNRKGSALLLDANRGSSYFSKDDEAIDGTLFFIKKLLSETKHLENRIIVVIPTLNDLKLIENGKKYKNLKWYLNLKEISQKTNTKFLDLANHFESKKYNEMIFSCDHHWNAFGHKEVANLLISKFY